MASIVVFFIGVYVSVIENKEDSAANYPVAIGGLILLIILAYNFYVHPDAFKGFVHDLHTYKAFGFIMGQVLFGYAITSIIKRLKYYFEDKL